MSLGTTRPETDTERRVPTRDGIALHLLHLRPTVTESLGAVVLTHGLGSNGIVFDLPGRSLARHLRDLGYHCFVPDLRGVRRSESPRGGFGMEDYLDQDLPAIIEAAREHSGHDRVHWVGHSMGGLLMFLYLIEHPDAPVDRVVTVASTLDYNASSNIYKTLLKVRPLLGPLPTLPFGLISRLTTYLPRALPPVPSESMNFYRKNIEPEVVRTVMREGFGDIPLRLLDGLATTFSERGFSTHQGTRTYMDRATRFNRPVCLIGGSADPQCPPPLVEATYALLGHVQDKQMKLVGKRYGELEDYGHFDLIVGRRAVHEVWPTIAGFLQKTI